VETELNYCSNKIRFSTRLSVGMSHKTKRIPRVLSIQSHVVHGFVGNKCAVFILQVFSLIIMKNMVAIMRINLFSSMVLKLMQLILFIFQIILVCTIHHSFLYNYFFFIFIRIQSSKR